MLLLATMMFAAAGVSATTSTKPYVIVIDAGHGGHDPGALGVKTNEKTINLAIARRLGDMLKTTFPDVKVVYTRSTDVFVKIRDRMQIAKDANADLFISIHCNSAATDNPKRKSLSGTSVYILGNENTDQNLNVVMAENSAILLEDDYRTKYQGFDNSPEQYIFMEICQSKMVGKSIELANEVQSQLVGHAGLRDNSVRQTNQIWLVLHSTMPLIFLETDFICNPEREAYLASERGQAKIAEAVVKGIAAYRKTKINLPTSGNVTVTDNATETDAPLSPSAATGTTYHVQFTIASSVLPEGSPKLKGLKPVEYYRDGNSYKYYYGTYTTMKEAQRALPEIKHIFPDAFVIKMVDGKRVK